MKYNLVSIKNPKWANPEKTLVDCEIVLEGMEDLYLPFTASKNDVEAHGRAIFADLVVGKYGVIVEYTE